MKKNSKESRNDFQEDDNEILFDKQFLRNFFGFCFPSFGVVDNTKVINQEYLIRLLNHFKVDFTIVNKKIHLSKKIHNLNSIVSFEEFLKYSEEDFFEKISSLSEQKDFIKNLKLQTQITKLLSSYLVELVTTRKMIQVDKFQKLFLIANGIKLSNIDDPNERKILNKYLKNSGKKTLSTNILKSVVWVGIDSNYKRHYFISPEPMLFLDYQDCEIDLKNFIGITVANPIEFSQNEECKNVLYLMQDYGNLPSFYSDFYEFDSDYSITDARYSAEYDSNYNVGHKSLCFKIDVKNSKLLNIINVVFMFDGDATKSEQDLTIIFNVNNLTYTKSEKLLKFLEDEFEKYAKLDKSFSYSRYYHNIFNLIFKDNKHDLELTFDHHGNTFVLKRESSNRYIRQAHENSLLIDFSKENTLISNHSDFLTIINIFIKTVRNYEKTI